MIFRRPPPLGFTLVELLITIAIMGIVVGLMAAVLENSRDRTYVSAMQSDLRNIAVYQEEYFVEHQHYVTSKDEAQSWALSENVELLSVTGNGSYWSASLGHGLTTRECSMTVNTNDNDDYRIRCLRDEVAIEASSSAPMSGEPVTFDAGLGITQMAMMETGLIGTPLLAADPDDIVEVRWVFGDGAEVSGPPRTHTIVQHTYEVPNQTVTTRVYITAKDGRTSYGARTLSIRGGVVNALPIAAITTSTPAEVGRPVTFDASGSIDIDGYVTEYLWDFGNGVDQVGTNLMETYSYPAPGTYPVRLIVTDNMGGRDTASVSLTVDSFNWAPLAAFDVNPAPLTQFDAITFDASSSSDPDGEVVSWHWDFGNGDTGEGVTVQHAWDGVDPVTVVLTVTDDRGRASSTQSTLDIVANMEPTASVEFGPNPAKIGEPVNFSVTATDPDGSIVTFEWDFDDGASTSGPTASHAYSSDGLYNVAVLVTDNDGATNRVRRTLVVEPPNQVPTAAFTVSQDPAQEDLPVLFDAASSKDADGGIESVAWDFGDGTTSSEWAPSHTYPDAGFYSVVLTVTDYEGATDTTTRTVEVVANMLPSPSFTASPSEDLAAGQVITFDATSSVDPDGEIVDWEWDFGDWNIANGEVVTYAFPTAGHHSVRLTVTDNTGAAATVERTVTVVSPNLAPVPVLECSRSEANPNQPIFCTAENAYDGDGSIVSYEFIWTGGEYMPGRQHKPSYWEAHNWTEPGTYGVTLLLTDDLGATASVSATFLIHAHGQCQDDDNDGDWDDNCVVNQKDKK